MYQDDYNKKVNSFVSNSSFTVANSDNNRKRQRDIRNAVSDCQQAIQTDDRWKYINLNTTAPTIRGLVKIHKEGASIRPVIKWKNAPASKLAKMLSKKLQAYVPLPYTFNVK